MEFSKYRSKPLWWWLRTPVYAGRIVAHTSRKLLQSSGWNERSFLRISYSQRGEDYIVRSLFRSVGIETPNYLDIGAYDPIVFSNTMMFYKRGSKGVCVEPDPKRSQYFARIRPRDTIVQAGIGDGSVNEAPFYVMSSPTLSSFDSEGCKSIESTGQAHIVETIQLPLLNINSIMHQYFPDGVDFLSLDVEGWDERILQSIDFKKFRPKVICVETIDFVSGEKRTFASQLLEAQGYSVHADTRINTIFRDTQVTWSR